MKVMVVQPRRDPEDYLKNIEVGVKYIEEAPNDVSLLVFPEGFPGPWWLAPDERAKEVVSKRIEDSEAFKTFSEALRGRRLYVGFGLTEKLNGKLYNAYAVMSSRGLVGVYRKVLPAVFELQAPSPISQAGEVKVWDIGGVKIGVSICWEALFPEIPRTVAKKGAEVLIFPTGGMLYELRGSWRTVWLARAVENLAYVLGNVNIYGDEEGLAIIAGPEGVLAESSVEGAITANLNLERIRWLRSIDEELTMPKKYKVVPGLLRWSEKIPKLA